MSHPFSEAQKQYLQGFMTGVIQRGDVPFAGETADGRITSDPETAERDLSDPRPDGVYGTPVDELSKQERIKLEQNPQEIWDTIVANAEAGRFPEGDDVFRYKALGLFYVAPAQEAFMLRCRIPGCMLTARQVRGLADVAARYGGGYADITTRGNFQIREIGARDPAKVLMALYDLGLTSRGAGADNVRNITASPTSGFDPNEVYDVRPLAKRMHHYILNSSDLYGLPRKFNIAFDSGGVVSVAANTNDLGFQAVRMGEGHDVEPGVYFRIELGGITGHGDFARDTGYMVRPEHCVAVAAAVLRVYLRHGDRTNRRKARLKYLLDDWGHEAFMERVQEELAVPLHPIPLDACEPRGPVVRHTHVGVHPQKQDGRNYVGIVVPVGRLKADQMRRLADLAATHGSGDLRLTIFQNLLLPDIPDDAVETVTEAILDMGLDYETPSVRSGLVACTGNVGCPYARSDTKGHALALGDYLEDNVTLDHPLNIHLTGCPHSCAQHYCGDIGLLGTKVKHEGETVEGYDIVLGGGMDEEKGIARPLVKGVPFEQVPTLIEEVLTTYRNRREEDESFVRFIRRHDADTLKSLFDVA